MGEALYHVGPGLERTGEDSLSGEDLGEQDGRGPLILCSPEKQNRGRKSNAAQDKVALQSGKGMGYPGGVQTIEVDVGLSGWESTVQRKLRHQAGHQADPF